jgi:uncharacterized protein
MKRKLKLAHGNWVEGDQFWDRETEVGRFIELLDEGAHILLVAQRRIGKTSLMREAARRIHDRYACLHVDLQKSRSAADAVVELSLAARPHERLWTRAQDVFRNVLNAASNKVESLQIDDLTIVLRGGLTAGNWKDKGDRLLGMLAGADKPVIVFFDEIAILINRMLKGDDYRVTPERLGDVDIFMSWLRENSIRHKGKLRLVLTGSIGIEPVLEQAGLSATLNTFSPFELRPWDSETAIGCLQALANQYRLQFGERAYEEVVQKLGCCIPHHVQTFFDAIYSACKDRNRHEATVDLVQDVFDSRMLGVRGHAELSHLEERLKLVLGPELHPLALELLTEAAVVGKLTADAADFLSRQYPVENRTPRDVLRHILGIFEHDGYLRNTALEFEFVSHLVQEWWKARFAFHYVPVAHRRNLT